jgi:hypothetical protein
MTYITIETPSHNLPLSEPYPSEIASEETEETEESGSLFLGLMSAMAIYIVLGLGLVGVKALYHLLSTR